MAQNNVVAAQEGALAKGQQAVRTAHSGIDRRMRTVRDQIQEIKGSWKGDAAVAFDSLMVQWDGETEKLNKILADLETSLQETERAQEQSEQSHQSALGNLASMLGE
ncbi:MAG: WXG100 family type VII secretion target [Bifidobacteriaceae bacterium]|jgi:WXG100 family type VII secretion target|nr:WXG100 family type VII secretion target [Bifidobacteriaceae bacterium]